MIVTILGLRLLQPSDPDDFAAERIFAAGGRRDAGRDAAAFHVVALRAGQDPPLYTRRVTFQPRCGEHGLVGLSAALQQRRWRSRSTASSILDSRRDATANRPDRNTPEIAVDPVVAAARRQQRDHRAAVGVGSAARASSTPSMSGRTRPAAGLRDAHAAVRDAARGVLGLAVDSGRHPRHHVADATPRAGLRRAGGSEWSSAWCRPSRRRRCRPRLIRGSPPCCWRPRRSRARWSSTFGVLFFGWRWPRYGLLLFAPGLVDSAGRAVRGPADAAHHLLFLGVPTVGCA